MSSLPRRRLLASAHDSLCQFIAVVHAERQSSVSQRVSLMFCFYHDA